MEQQPQLEPVLDVDAVAKLLRCASKTVEQRTRDGDLPGLKFGDSWIYPLGALLVRLNALATEQAASRRRPPARPSAVLTSLPGGRGGRRGPPKLPEST